jgi:hypothetical protein
MSIDSERLAFYLGSFVAPALLVLFNLIVRKVKRWYFTAGSDFLLMLATFSFSFAALSKDVSPYIRNENLRNSANAVFLTLGLFILISWYLAVSVVEVAINESIRHNRRLALIPQFKVFVAWASVVGFTGLELMIFLKT